MIRRIFRGIVVDAKSNQPHKWRWRSRRYRREPEDVLVWLLVRDNLTQPCLRVIPHQQQQNIIVNIINIGDRRLLYHPNPTSNEISVNLSISSSQINKPIASWKSLMFILTDKVGFTMSWCFIDTSHILLISLDWQRVRVVCTWYSSKTRHAHAKMARDHLVGSMILCFFPS